MCLRVPVLVFGTSCSAHTRKHRQIRRCLCNPNRVSFGCATRAAAACSAHADSCTLDTQFGHYRGPGSGPCQTGISTLCVALDRCQCESSCAIAFVLISRSAWVSYKDSVHCACTMSRRHALGSVVLLVLLLVGIRCCISAAVWPRSEIDTALLEEVLGSVRVTESHDHESMEGVPSPLPSTPPVYDMNRTATVVITGTQVVNSNGAGEGPYAYGLGISFLSGIRYATVYPNNDPGSFRLINATALLKNNSFLYFIYYKSPIAQYSAENSAGRATVADLYTENQTNPDFVSAAVMIKRLRTTTGNHGEFSATFSVFDPHNTSALPNIPNSLLDFGVLGIQNVPCENAGISC